MFTSIPQKRYPDNYDQNPERRKIQRAGERKKLCLVKDARPDSFVDLVVEIVAVFTKFSCDVLATDYTTNTQLQYRPAPEETNSNYGSNNYGSQSSSNHSDEPYGQQIISINLRPPHSDFVERMVRKRDIVLFQNVRIKMDQRGMLEANLFPDQRYPNKVLVQRLMGREMPEVVSLLERKEQYTISRGGFSNRAGVPAQVTTVSKPVESPSVTSAKANTAGRKKKKKVREEQNVKEREQLQEVWRREEEKEKEKKKTTSNQPAASSLPNKHIRCSHPEVELTRLQDICEYRHPSLQRDDGSSFKIPFLNLQFRARVKVLDYLPNDLADFAILAIEEESLSDDENRIQRRRQRWEWNCQLFVENTLGDDKTSNSRMMLNMGHKQMQYLLGNDMPDADDLRRNTSLRSKLSQKMAILWGDLEEQKAARKMFLNLRPTNLPFDCCIAEYGVLKKDGIESDPEHWSRQYMCGGINIL